jgi:hypothetical protein
MAEPFLCDSRMHASRKNPRCGLVRQFMKMDCISIRKPCDEKDLRTLVLDPRPLRGNDRVR